MATLQIPIAKAGKGNFFAVDSDEVQAMLEGNPSMLTEAITTWLEVRLNARMSKGISAPTKLADTYGVDSKEYKDNAAAALAKAAENFADLQKGKPRKTTSASKAQADALYDDAGNKVADARAVVTRAVQKAREAVKTILKRNKIVLSHVPAKDITAKAKEFVETDPSFLAEARKELLESAKVASGITSVDDILASIKPDPKKVAKANAEKAERKSQLSAKQAGIPAKGKVPPRKPMTATQAEGVRH